MELQTAFVLLADKHIAIGWSRDINSGCVCGHYDNDDNNNCSQSNIFDAHILYQKIVRCFGKKHNGPTNNYCIDRDIV